MKLIKTLVISCFLILSISLTYAAEDKKEPVTAILGAMNDELNVIKEETTNQKTVEVSGLTFTTGELRGKGVVFARTGMGKVNAAMTTALLVNHFNPKAVIFTGVAGGLNPDLFPGDVVIGEKTIQHDLVHLKSDSFEQFVVWNPVNGKNNPVFFTPDSKLLGLAEEAKNRVELEKIITSKGERVPQIIKGIIVTGDTFCGSSAKNTELRKDFKADAVEMEGAAVAQVCHQLNVPCIVIRSLSDSANENIDQDFKKFCKIAARNSGRFVVNMVELMSKRDAHEITEKTHDKVKK